MASPNVQLWTTTTKPLAVREVAQTSCLARRKKCFSKYPARQESFGLRALAWQNGEEELIE